MKTGVNSGDLEGM